MLRSVVIAAGILTGGTIAVSAEEIDFNRDVRPLLSDLCFQCHGPDRAARKGDLRLDRSEDAVRLLDSGRQPIVPGRPQASEVIRRLESSDPDEMMPPPKTGKRPTSEEIRTLRRWIAAGARYDTHWSFKPIEPVDPPTPDSQVRGQPPEGPVNPIDAFVAAGWAKRQWRFSPEANRETLLRWVSFDLTGLPPSLEELDTFLNDANPGAYERAVDRLLASGHFGERMAVDWLDAARYADTNGYFGDKTRDIWPWRDWVVAAFNENLPFDRFTIEQLAGDLIPEATVDQRIATGFNRNHMVTNESGAIDEEYRIEYVADRLETTGAVWLGLTVGCARCHDHKYDPLSQADYYRMFAFFNNAVETGLVRAESPPPVMEVPDPEAASAWEAAKARVSEEKARLDEAMTAHRQAYEIWESNLAKRAPVPTARGLTRRLGFEPGEESARPVGSIMEVDGVAGRGGRFDAMQHLEWPSDTALAADHPWTLGWWMNAEGSLSGVLGKIEPKGRRRGFEVYWQKGRLHVHFIETWGIEAIELVTRDPMPNGRWQHVVVRYDGSGKASGVTLFVNGNPTALETRRDTLSGSISNAEPFRIGRRDEGLGYYGLLDEVRLYDRTLPNGEVRDWWWGEQARALLAIAPKKRSETQSELLMKAFAETLADPSLRQGFPSLERARSAEAEIRATLPRTLVMEELPEPRTTQILNRGQYDQPGEAVSAGVPAFLPALSEGTPRNRLGLAQWLVSAEHPLTPRVAVNRLWRLGFGEGLVKTMEDFGLQGEPPSHPELLDWLARRFVDSGWDMKAMLRLIVTSRTYRQSSVPSTDLAEADPENRLLARGPRFRLSAEMIRDQALAASGLLSARLGGPGVMPYQPPGLWEDVTYDGEDRYEADRDDGLWRRSLYTFWKRQLPPPTLQAFDSPTREKCSLRRARTNTPLQALVLLNDQTYLEAGRALASKVITGTSGDPARIDLAFRSVLSRHPTAGESALLIDLLHRQRERFRGDPAAARRIVAVGVSPVGRDLDPAELASWTLTVHTLFNLDEAIARR